MPDSAGVVAPDVGRGRARSRRGRPLRRSRDRVRPRVPRAVREARRAAAVARRTRRLGGVVRARRAALHGVTRRLAAGPDARLHHGRRCGRRCATVATLVGGKESSGEQERGEAHGRMIVPSRWASQGVPAVSAESPSATPGHEALDGGERAARSSVRLAWARPRAAAVPPPVAGHQMKRRLSWRSPRNAFLWRLRVAVGHAALETRTALPVSEGPS